MTKLEILLEVVVIRSSYFSLTKILLQIYLSIYLSIFLIISFPFIKVVNGLLFIPEDAVDEEGVGEDA